MVGPHNKKSKLFGSTDFQKSTQVDKEKEAARLKALQVDNTKAARRQAEEVKRVEKHTGLGVYPVPIAVDSKQ